VDPCFRDASTFLKRLRSCTRQIQASTGHLLKNLPNNHQESLNKQGDWCFAEHWDQCLEMSQDWLGLEPEDTKKTLNINKIEQVRHALNNETNPSERRRDRTTTVQLTVTNPLGRSPSADVTITRSILDRRMQDKMAKQC
jgi:hypothetical protein